MFCGKCGTKTEENAKFCASCGASVVSMNNAPKAQMNNAPKLNNRKYITIITIAVVVFIGLIISVVTLLFRDESKQPDIFPELVVLGDEYLRNGEYEQALEYFVSVLEENHMNPRGYTGIAESLIGLEREDEAFAILVRSVEFLPYNTEIQTMIHNIADINAGNAIEQFSNEELQTLNEDLQHQLLPDKPTDSEIAEAYLRILRNEGIPTYYNTWYGKEVENGIISVAVVDLDNDGIPELVYSRLHNYFDLSILVYGFENQDAIKLIDLALMDKWAALNNGFRVYSKNNGGMIILDSEAATDTSGDFLNHYHVFNILTSNPGERIFIKGGSWDRNNLLGSAGIGYIIDGAVVSGDVFYHEEDQILSETEYYLTGLWYEYENENDVSMSYLDAIDYLIAMLADGSDAVAISPERALSIAREAADIFHDNILEVSPLDGIVGEEYIHESPRTGFELRFLLDAGYYYFQSIDWNGNHISFLRIDQNTGTAYFFNLIIDGDGTGNWEEVSTWLIDTGNDGEIGISNLPVMTTKRIEFPVGSSEKFVDVKWGAELFSHSSNLFNNDLALLSAALAGATYNIDGNSRSDGYFIYEAFKTLGFQSEKINLHNYPGHHRNQYEQDSNILGYAIASRDITINGEHASLLVIALRGSQTYYDLAIAGTTTVTTRYPHANEVYNGFIAFHNFILTGLRDYFTEHTLSNNVHVLITGHSLGGAAAQLVSATVQNFNWIEESNVHTYTIGSPNPIATRSNSGIVGSYKNIYNIVNPRNDHWIDFPSARASKFGIILAVPSIENWNRRSNIASFEKEYSDIMKVDIPNARRNIGSHDKEAYIAWIKANPTYGSKESNGLIWARYSSASPFR